MKKHLLIVIIAIIFVYIIGCPNVPKPKEKDDGNPYLDGRIPHILASVDVTPDVIDPSGDVEITIKLNDLSIDISSLSTSFCHMEVSGNSVLYECMEGLIVYDPTDDLYKQTTTLDTNDSTGDWFINSITIRSTDNNEWLYYRDIDISTSYFIADYNDNFWEAITDVPLPTVVTKN